MAIPTDAQSKRRPYNHLAGYVACRRNRATGDFNVMYDATRNDMDSDGGRWVVVCEAHGSMVAQTNRTLAYASMNGPSAEFCATCRGE